MALWASMGSSKSGIHSSMVRLLVPMVADLGEVAGVGGGVSAQAEVVDDEDVGRQQAA